MLKRFKIRDCNQTPVSFAYLPTLIKATEDDIYTLMAIKTGLALQTCCSCCTLCCEKGMLQVHGPHWSLRLPGHHCTLAYHGSWKRCYQYLIIRVLRSKLGYSLNPTTKFVLFFGSSSCLFTVLFNQSEIRKR